MTIASEITRINGNIAAAYTAANNKGATLPATQNSANLATCIGTITGGGTAVIQSLNVAPSTSAQTITAPGGVDGYSPVNVSAVTSSIDANITSANIVDGITILGVTGSATELKGTTLNVTPTTAAQTITPTSPNNGFTEVDVDAVTSSIDANIQAGNIKNGVTILGVTGNYSGITPSGTLSITQNGTYDVTNYASASVSVSGGGGYSELPSYQVSNGVASKRSGALTGNEFSGITSVDTNGLQYAFYGCSGLTGNIDLSSLTSVGSNGLSYAFDGCTNLTSVDLSALTTVGNYGMQHAFDGCNSFSILDLSALTSVGDYGLQYAFDGCTGLTSVDLSSLKNIGMRSLYYAFRDCTNLTSVDLSALKEFFNSGLYYAFQNCTSLTSVDLSSLATVGTSCLYYAFSGCTSLTSFNFPSLISVDTQALLSAFNACTSLTTVNFPLLKTLTGNYPFRYCFDGCTSITDVYFRALTTTSFGNVNGLQNMMRNTGTTVTHTLHFPSNLQNTISGLSGYPLFSGTSGYVVCAFDLPATE